MDKLTNNGQIRDMTSADVAAVMSVESEELYSSWTALTFLDALSAGNLARVFEVGDQIVGYIVVQVFDQMGEILTIGVAKNVRRQGVASCLIEHVLVDLQELVLEVRCSNLIAIALYTKQGFVEIGVRKRYYSRNGEDAIVMKLLKK